MPTRSSPLRLVTALALSSAMLSACAGSSARRPAPAVAEPAPDPVVEVRTERRLVCPAELDVAAEPQPAPPEGVTASAPRAYFDWLKAVIAWGRNEAALRADAKAACDAARTLGAEAAPS